MLTMTAIYENLTEYFLDNSEITFSFYVDHSKKLRSCRGVACYVSTVHLLQNEQYQ
jgi:hypothetical protein